LIPSTLQSLEGKRKFLSLIKTYMDLGGHHIQFNVIDANTLKDAQLHPENYHDLVGGVASFSAFFITLEKFVQEEIIERTEYRFEGI
jgi:formate C-acetyltransferase